MVQNNNIKFSKIELNALRLRGELIGTYSTVRELVISNGNRSAATNKIELLGSKVRSMTADFKSAYGRSPCFFYDDLIDANYALNRGMLTKELVKCLGGKMRELCSLTLLVK
jgi:hypothetical protein